jgi:Putative adhesin
MRFPVTRHGLVLVAACVVSAQIVLAQTRQQAFTYAVSPKPVISVRNSYGKITVKPGTSAQVVANVTYTDKVAVQGGQNGNMIRLSSQQVVTGQAATADYELQVPEEATIIVTSSSGSIIARDVRGDLVFEAAESAVDIAGISHAHIHVKTLGGSVTVANVSDSHLDISTISGNVALRDISRAVVYVHSGSGRIQYDGDPGAGFYELKSHSGDIDVSLPATASVGVATKTCKGHIENGFPVEAKSRVSLLPKHSTSLMHSRGPAASFVLHSFSGNIRARQR